MNLKTEALVLILVYAVNSCLDSNEIQGKCSDCLKSQLLVAGTCLEKLQGCLVHQMGPLCSQCQIEYSLVEGRCFLANNSLISSKQNTTKVTKYENIKIEIPTIEALQYMKSFESLHMRFLSKYREILNGGSVEYSDHIQNKAGTYLIIVYKSKEGYRFEGMGFIEQTQAISPRQIFFRKIAAREEDTQFLFKKLISTSSKNPKDLIEIQIKKIASQTGLTPKQRLSFIFEEPNLIFVEMGFIPENQQIYDKKMSLLEYSRMKILEKYQQLSRFKDTEIHSRQNGNICIFKFLQEFSISAEFRKQVIVNAPIYLEQIPTTRESLTSGRYLPFQQYTDPLYATAYQHILHEFPQLQSIPVNKVMIQIVAGANFLIFINQKSDSYIFKVYSSFLGEHKILRAYRNKEQIYNSNYDYNRDKNFFEAYQGIESKLKRSLPIYAVHWKKYSRGLSYKVVYSIHESVVFQIQREGMSPILVQSSAGLNMLVLSNKNLNSNKPIEEIVSFLAVTYGITNQNIISFISESPTYGINFVTAKGTFKVALEDNNSKLSVVSQSKISNLTCFQLSESDLQKQRIMYLDSVIRGTYILNNFALVTVQKHIKEGSYQYMFLYSNQKMKQLQVMLSAKGEQIQITNGRQINFGYEIIDEKQQNDFFKKLASFIEKSEKNYTLLLAEFNETSIRGYYENGQETKSVECDLKTQQFGIKLLDRKNYLSIPNQFSYENLIYPSVEGNNIPLQDRVMALTAMNTVALKYSNYMKNPILAFAEKQTSTPTADKIQMLIKISVGFVKVIANVNKDLSSVELLQIAMTSYKANEFSGCRKFDLVGECLSCSSEQVSYQGSCYTKIEGCLIQASNLCLKCSPSFIQSGFKCFIECQTIFL